MTKKWIRIVFRCNFCGGDHAYPLAKNRWGLESEVHSYLKEHLMMCPGVVDMLLPPHIEVIDPETDELIRHSDHFSVLEYVERPN